MNQNKSIETVFETVHRVRMRRRTYVALLVTCIEGLFAQNQGHAYRCSQFSPEV